MIDPSELRIGNLMVFGEETVQVSIIYSGHFYCKRLSDNLDIGNSHQSNFIPIQLTEEWLLKFGFKGGDLDFKGGALRVDIENSEIGIFIGSKDQLEIHMDYDHIILPRDIQYVHQLQNLYFALTETELTL